MFGKIQFFLAAAVLQKLSSLATATTGLEIGSLIAGGYGAVKGVVAFTKLARTPQQVAKVAKLSAKTF
jgi:hypothetical protein